MSDLDILRTPGAIAIDDLAVDLAFLAWCEDGERMQREAAKALARRRIRLSARLALTR